MKTKNVHEYTNDQGTTRWAIGIWSDQNAQYTCPLDALTAKLTGCHIQYARKLSGMGSFTTKAAATRYARKVYGYVNSHEEAQWT